MSAVENGRSPLPARKRRILSDIFGESELLFFTIDEDREAQAASRAIGNLSESQLMQQLKKLFQAHGREREYDDDSLQVSREEMDSLQERIRRLWVRNETLTEKNSDLQSRIDTLADKMEASTQEIYRLRELLLRNNINF